MEKEPSPTESVMQTMISVVSTKKAARSRKTIWPKNEKLVKYFRTCVVDK